MGDTQLITPKGESVNDHVTKNRFDGSPFALKFPTIDNIVEGLRQCKDDPVVLKVDIARDFCILRVGSVDGLK